MNTLVISNSIDKLKKGPYIERKKLYPILKELNEDEIDEILSDEEIFNLILKSRDDNILAMAFRYGGIKTQEKIWENVDNQKRLLGIGRVDDIELMDLISAGKFYHSNELEKKKKSGKFYFSKERMRILELFMRSIKSPKILDELTSNKYYQMILLFSKKVPENVVKRVNVPKLFYNTVNEDLYNYATPRLKTGFCTFLNSCDTRLFLPNDYLQIFTETKINNYYVNDKGSIGNLLRTKLYHLAMRKEKLDVSYWNLKLLSVRELMILVGADDEVVDKELLKESIIEIISDAIKDGSILSDKFIDFELLDNKNYFPIFKTIVEVMTGGDKCSDFLNYIFDKLFQGEYSKEEKDNIFPLLKNCLLNIDSNTATSLFYRPSDVKSMFFCRFGLSSRYMDYLNGISPSQILNLNVRHINKIAGYLQDETQDEISDIYSKAIKMYFTFGLDRSISILEGQYGDVSKRFLDNVSKLMVKDVELRKNGKKYEPILNDNFITFLFKSGQIKHVFDGESNMSMNWYYLYNNIDDLKDLCHGHLTFPKVEIILKEKLNTTNYPLPPDCFRLDKYMHEIGIGNKTQNKTNAIYDEAVDIHKKQLQRIESTIPYVSGVSSNGYRYETMKLHDAIAFVLGYRAGCCIRVLDIAHKHLLHALHSESGRILIIYDSDNNPVAFSPLKRNGELLIANSIEAIARNNFDEIKDTFMDGIMSIVNVTKKGDEPIKVATIGRGSYNKPDSTQWPSSIPTPTILEKDNPLYRNTDEYHKSLNIIYQDEDCSLKHLHYGESKNKYIDPRDGIKVSDFSDEDEYLSNQDALNIINAVDYTMMSDEDKLHFRGKNSYGIKFVFYGEDWYIILHNNHALDYKCMNTDPRSKVEMDTALNLVREALNKKDIKQLVLSLNKKGACN